LTSSRQGQRNLPPVTLGEHGLGDLDETSDVGSSNQGWELALGSLDVLLAGLQAVVESSLHDALELGIDLLCGPAQALAVLGHLETGNGDTTGVGSLAGSVPDGLVLLALAVSLEDIDSVLCATHVGTLSNETGTRVDERLSLLLGDLVLGSTRKSNVDLDVGPGAGAVNVLVLTIVGEVCEGLTLDLQGGDLLNVGRGEGLAFWCEDSTLGVRKGDDGGTELDGLKSSILSNVSGTGDGNGLACEGALVGVLDHVLNVLRGLLVPCLNRGWKENERKRDHNQWLQVG
jgi:hypothetical protein